MVIISSRSDGTTNRSTSDMTRAISRATFLRNRSACTKSTDEEIQDLETLTVPVDLRDLRLEQATSNLTAWCADAAAVGRDVIRLVQNHADAAAATEFNAKVADMRQLAQSALGTLSAAAVALKVEATPIDLRTVGPLPG